MNDKYVIMNTMNKELKFVKGIEIGEIWRPVKDFEESHEVSTLGRVRSIDRIVHSIRRGKPYSALMRGKIFAPNINPKGYARVMLKGNGKKCKRFVHRMVATAFLGEIPEGMVVCHSDNNPSNNLVGNLRIDTQTGNFKDKIANGTMIYGRKAPMNKLTEEEVLEIRERYDNGGSPTKLGQEFNVSKSLISSIGKRKIWKWL